MNAIQIVLVVAVVALVVYKQVTGRFARPAPVLLLLPLLLCAAGVWSLVDAHPAVTVTGLVVVGIGFVVTAVLGVARGAVIRLESRDGWLYQRGGVPLLVLWALTIGIRFGIEALAGPLGIGALAAATLTLSFGVSLLVQSAVLGVRVARDPRPVRPRPGAARAPEHATL